MPDRESTRKERVKGPEDVEPEQSVSQGRQEWRGGSPGPVDMGLSPGGEGNRRDGSKEGLCAPEAQQGHTLGLMGHRPLCGSRALGSCIQ